MGKNLRVNLTNSKISEEPLSEDIARKYVGSKALSAKILFDELKPGIDPSDRTIKWLSQRASCERFPFPVTVASLFARNPRLDSHGASL